MDGAAQLSWDEGNRERLRLAFLRLTLALEGKPEDGHAIDLQIATLAPQMVAPAAPEHIAEAFGLDETEISVLLLAAIADQPPKLAKGLQAHPLAHDGRATPALVAALWGEADALAAGGPLRRHRLISLAEGRHFERQIHVAEPVLEALAGRVAFDGAYQGVLQGVRPPESVSLQSEAVNLGRAMVMATEAGQAPVFWCAAEEGAEQAAQVAAVLAGVGRRGMRLSAIPEDVRERAEMALCLDRDLRLSGQVLLLMASENAGHVWDFAERLNQLCFVLGAAPDAGFQGVALRLPALPMSAPWAAVLGEELASQPEVKTVAESFALSPPQIRRAASALAAGLAPDLWTAAQAEVGDQMGHLAHKISRPAQWEDLILPDAQAAALRQMASFLTHREQVNAAWGFAEKSGRGLGMAAVFYGPSGTGKTTAAEALIQHMRPRAQGEMPLYRVNIASLVSKYIGETAKNFERVFSAGKAMGAGLLFDECEGLFARRSGNAKDSNDKHANAELGFLLQCLENYEGVAILTTNMRSAIDDAFFRRFRFAIEFPFPDRAARRAIWQRVLPDAMPRGVLDYDALSVLSLSGGNIRSIALNAAYLAASAESEVTMAHFAHAARLEFAKLEKTVPERELRGWQA